MGELLQARGIGLLFRQGIPMVEGDDPFQAAPGRDEVIASFIDRGQDAEHRGFSRLVAELDVMFRGVVQTAFGSDEVAAIQIALSQLAVGDGQSFFIADDPMVIERQGETRGAGDANAAARARGRAGSRPASTAPPRASPAPP